MYLSGQPDAQHGISLSTQSFKACMNNSEGVIGIFSAMRDHQALALAAFLLLNTFCIPCFHKPAMALQNICAPLSAKSTFEDYIRVINSTLGVELQNIEACKLEICREIYGTGNSDIAGPRVRISGANLARHQLTVNRSP